jgi:hypothetical protein
MPSPQSNDIEPRMPLLKDRDRDAAELRSQSQVCENRGLCGVAEMSAMVKQDNYTAMRNGGGKSLT